MNEGKNLKNQVSLFDQQASLFDQIEKSNIKTMLQCLGAKKRTYKKNEFLLLTGEPTQSVGYILSGAVQIIKEDILGNRNLLAQLGHGSLFGEAFVCAGLKESQVSVLAVEESEVLYLELGRILTTCSSACMFHTKLIENLLKILAQKNIMLNQKIELVSKRSIREKLMAYFVSLMEEKNSYKFEIPFDRSQLADYLCIDRSAMSRELGKMKREGLIEYHKNQFTYLGEERNVSK